MKPYKTTSQCGVTKIGNPSHNLNKINFSKNCPCSSYSDDSFLPVFVTVIPSHFRLLY